MSQSISRKDFLRSTFGFLKSNGLASIKTHNITLPPGAQNHNDFLQNCEKNYDCVSACPHEAIRVYRSNEKDAFYSYPVIEPRNQPCYMCKDLPCIDACQSKALIKNNTINIGIAVINKDECFAYNENFCQACVTNCPEPGAIAMNEINQPIINEKACTGCGVCVYSCTKEKSAIYINIK